MEKKILQLGGENNRVKTLEEDYFQEKMLTEIEPLLQSIKKSGYFSRESQRNLYYEEYLSKDAVKNIVISHGFTENAEKYKELIYYFYKQKYNVFIMDHQGHGKSFRLVEDYSITHIERFEDYIADLNAFVEKKVIPDRDGKPVILFCHSMGGAIGAGFLEKFPGIFEKAVFSSPMFEIDSGNIPLWVGKMIADFKTFTGRKTEFVFTQSRFNKEERFEDSCSVSRERYNYFFQKRLKEKEYQNYCSTYSWLRQSVLATKRILRPENLEKINIPVIVFQAENDTVVKARGQERFVAGVENSKLIFVPESKHEIYMAYSKIFAPYLETIFEFIG